MNSKVLPDSYLRCMTPAQRQEIGQKTAAEVLSAGVAKSEKDLQKQIVGLLRLKGIEPIVSRMDRRTSNNVGTPDILFAVTGDLRAWEWGSEACAWEVKMPQGKLSPEQEAMGRKLKTAPNGWSHEIIRSVDEAIAALKSMGVE
jgi:hypothetical protein